jgi:hypothetical protein
MPRRTLQAQLAAYAQRIQTDHGWTATREEHAAALGRLVDQFIADTDLYRELAAVRAASNRTIAGLEAENAQLRARLAAQEGARL